MHTLHTPNSIIESCECHCVGNAGLSQCQVCSVGEFDVMQAAIISGRPVVSLWLHCDFLGSAEGPQRARSGTGDLLHVQLRGKETETHV